MRLKTPPKPKRAKHPLPYWAAAAACAVIFFAIAFSTLDIYSKVVGCIAALILCGKAVERAGGFIGGYGIVVLRGRNGFNVMKSLAQKYRRQALALSELGLTLFFGVLYGWRLFKKQPTKLVAHAVILLFFAWAFQMTAVGYADLTPVFYGISVLFGLATTFFLIIALNAFSITTNFEQALPGAMPAIPGVTLPVEAIISIIVLMVAHELAHGILFFIEKLRVKSSGVILFGFIPVGAFVEQDEKEFSKAPLDKQRRVLVAGSTSNFLVAFVFALVSVPLAFAFAGASGGVFVHSVAENSSVAGILPSNSTIIALNGEPIGSTMDLGAALQKLNASDTAVIQTLEGGTYSVVLKEKSKLGVVVSNAAKKGQEFLHGLLALLFSVANLTALLNLMIALFNMMPLFITDGHLIIKYELQKAFGPRRAWAARLAARAIGIIFLAILLVNFLPWLKG
ncbi:MAG: site-2 protease family protein [Candidatus Micrarchaeota archaeon]